MLVCIGSAGLESENTVTMTIRTTTVTTGAIVTALMLSASLSTLAAEGAAQVKAASRPIDGIMDNSFLIEEAYNQESGVVQHIFTAEYYVQRLSGSNEEIWETNFTQEWPLFSQKHQLSYTVPYLFSDDGSTQTDGLGDVLLNYRYQVYYDEKTLRAFAPRASVVLPTGSKSAGFTDDTFGAQVNLPFSAAWGDRWFTHFNAGCTFLPDAATVGENDAWHYNLGASVIYAATSDFHFLLEWVGNWNNLQAEDGGQKHEFVTLISPGVRKAFNFSNGMQIVLGAAVPVGLNRASPDIGVFLYLSIEHDFLGKNPAN